MKLVPPERDEERGLMTVELEAIFASRPVAPLSQAKVLASDSKGSVNVTQGDLETMKRSRVSPELAALMDMDSPD